MKNKHYLIQIVLVTIGFCHCHVDQMAFEPEHISTNNFNTDDTSLFFTDSGTSFMYTEASNLEEDIPIIIWWTGRMFPGDDVRKLTCPTATCYSTSNRKYMNDPRTYGFHFYGTDLSPDDMPFPRKPHHEWSLYHEESPMNNYILVHSTMLKLFNHTATFRRESDYPITSHSLPSIDYLVKRKPVSTEDKNEARKEGLAPVLFAQSHCDIASDRERYVSELMKHIAVDSIGSCLHNKDIPKNLRDPVESMDSEKFYDLIAKYKFHLAFENAICKDYMTEKLFRPLHVGSVPVCKGSELARDWMPDNKSVIMADDFSSPKELAQFLQNLDENDEAYEEYLQYKKTGIRNSFLTKEIEEREWAPRDLQKPDSIVGFECYVCQKLTERYQVEKMHKSDPTIPLLPPKMADGKHLNCPQPHPSIGTVDDLTRDDSWMDQYWITDYWAGLEKAKALAAMAESNEKDPGSFNKYWERFMQINFD